jgi:integrase
MTKCYDIMASVNKDPRGKSPFWYACYTTAEGVRKRVSTELSDKRAAEKVAEAKQRAENERRKGTISTQRIVDLLNDTLRSAGLEEIETIRVKNWLEDWLKGKRKISKASRVAYEQAVREFLEFLGLRANAPIESITEKDINAFVDHLRKDGRSATTINKLVRQYLSGAFEKARKLGKIKYNPVAATDALPNDSSVKDVFSALQVARLVKAAKGTDWEGAILLAYGTGARLQDVCNFKWDAIDTEHGVVTFRERKTKKQAIVGLHPDFLDWISEERSGTDNTDAYLFPSLANKDGGGGSGLSEQFDALMRAAGVEGRILREGSKRDEKGKRTGKGRTVRSLGFHSFRHTAASAVFNSEAIKEVQRRVTNHARGGVIDRYTHADLDLIKQAVTLIPRLPKGNQ